MKIIKALLIVLKDRRLGAVGRNDRVNKLNRLLGFDRRFTTSVHDTGKHKYVVDYKRSQFWYDNKPIRIRNIIDNYGWWHVQIWEIFGKSGSRCGFTSTMIRSRFGRKKIYEWLEAQSERYDEILSETMYNME